MGFARVQLSGQFLADSPLFPKGTRIPNARKGESHDTIDIIVEHPDLPEIKTGEEYVLANPTYRTLPQPAAFSSWF